MLCNRAPISSVLAFQPNQEDLPLHKDLQCLYHVIDDIIGNQDPTKSVEPPTQLLWLSLPHLDVIIMSMLKFGTRITESYLDKNPEHAE